jgi:microcystin-dependent protein
MSFDWNDYSGDSDTEDVSLLLSVRSQSLILAVMRNLEARTNWVEVDDATWDEIDAAIGEAYEEIMESVMPDFTPVGAITMWLGLSTAVPEKWLLCEGATVHDGDDYPDLYAVLDDSFKDAFGNFVLPNFHDRFIRGVADDSEIGDLGGANQHTLVTAEIPAHNHVQRTRGGTAGAIPTTAGYLANASTPLTTSTSTTADTGGSAAHNNMPAYLSAWWIIKALP